MCRSQETGSLSWETNAKKEKADWGTTVDATHSSDPSKIRNNQKRRSSSKNELEN